MAKKSIRVKNLEKTFKKMDKYEKSVGSIIDKEAKKLVINIVADGQIAAPIDIGFLVSNIVVQVRKNTYKAKTKAKYSAVVDKRKPFFLDQGLKKLKKFLPKIRSIIKGL